MDRRSFIKKTSITTAGIIAAPFILPSGRLFAATGSQLAQHVVFVLMAGGVRQQESILQGYLETSQGLLLNNLNVPGNIMYNLFEGTAPSTKVVYGTTTNLDGDTPIPKILNQSLQKQGTVLRELKADAVGHYAGLNALLTGNYGYAQGLRQKPIYPTIFEYARKHLGLPATKTWFIGNGIMNSIPLLNHSIDETYGIEYGANFFAPGITFGDMGEEHLNDAKSYHPDEELEMVYRVKYFLNNVWMASGKDILSIKNTEEEKYQIKTFIEEIFDKKATGDLIMPPITDSGDLRNIGYCCEVLKEFEPNLTVINLNNVDGCHSSFTGYLKALHRSDHGVGFLWDYTQNNIPNMSGNTIMIAIPECGRNIDPNPILDENDWHGYDHSDQNSQRVFGVMAGPNVDVDRWIENTANPNTPIGNIIDAVPTISDILGFPEIKNLGYIRSDAESFFDKL